MPLASILPPLEAERQHVEEYHDAVQMQQQTDSNKCGTDNERDSGYGAFDDEELFDSDMEGSVMDRPRPKKSKSNLAAPSLPQRSDKRTSMILDNVILDLKHLDGKRNRLDQGSTIGEEDPHQTYLSSEEEASLSDDYDDSLLDSDLEECNDDDEESSSRPSSRRSQEDTARIVSFVMVGKPQIVDIVVHSSPTVITQEALNAALTKSTPVSTRSKPLHRPSPLKLHASLSRPLSIASNISITPEVVQANAIVQPAPTHSTSYIVAKPQSQPVKNTSSHSSSKSIGGSLPPRKSSRIASNLSSLVSSTKSTLQHTLSSHSAISSQSIDSRPHSFLAMDPFEAEHYHSPTSPSPTTPRSNTHQYSASVSTPVTPKTPTEPSSSHWKMSRNLTRTLSKARKPSMPKINLAYTNGVVVARNTNATNGSRTSLALSHQETNASQTSKEQEAQMENEQLLSTLSRRSVTMPAISNSQSQHTAQEAKESKISYDNIMRSAVKAPAQTSIATTAALELKKGAMGAMMGLGRIKSAKSGRKS